MDFIVSYFLIGIPFMLYTLKDINASFQQVYFSGFGWPIIVFRYIKKLYNK